MSETHRAYDYDARLFHPRWTRWAGPAMHIDLADGRKALVFFNDWVQYVPGRTKPNGALHIVNVHAAEPHG